MLIYLFIAIIVTIIFLFSSKTLSPIPYFPSQQVDIPLIIKALSLKNNQTVFDLGAGDGIIIFEAAKSTFERNLNTKFVAVEINPILILVLYFRRLFHPNRKNIKIVRDDIFKMNFSKFLTSNSSILTFYLYISPWYLEKTILNVKKQIHQFKTVSYMYSIKSLKKEEKISKGKNNIYIYSSNG